MTTYRELTGPGLIRILIGVFCLLSVSACTSDTPPATPEVQWQKETQTLFDGSVGIAADTFWTARFTIGDNVRNVRVSGEFRASGGGGNDIEAVVAGSNQFDNWVNGHAAEVSYKSDQTTYGQIALSGLAPGDYVLGFSNKFSVISAKTVTGHVVLTYEQPR